MKDIKIQKIIFKMQWLLPLLLFVSIGYAAEKPIRKILVLHSYHQGLEWTDNVTDGIKEAMRPLDEETELYFEYLDTKRYPDTLYFKQIQSFYRERLSQSRFDLIIAVDDDALKFLSQNREELYQNIPVVFCGINKPITSQHLNDSLMTGIVEHPDFKATIELMLRLHPKTEKIYAVNDKYTTTAQLNRVVLDSLNLAFDDKINFIDNVSLKELKQLVKKIGKKDLILMLTFNKDRDNHFISYKEEARIVVENAHVPVYSSWDFFMGRGIVGGYLFSGKLHGKLTGELAIRILNGEPISAIPIVNEPSGQYQFDYNQLKKYEIELGQLPKGSKIINKPVDFYVLNKSIIALIAVVFGIGMFVILVLSRSIHSRKKAEKQLLVKQEHLGVSFEQQRLMAEIVTYLNSTNDFTQVIDKVLNAITGSTQIGKVSIYSFSDGDRIGQIIGSRTSEKGNSMVELDRNNVFAMRELINQILSNKTIVCNDLSELTNEEQHFYRSRGIESVLLVPIKVADKIIGLAGFALPEPHEWKDDELRLLSTLVRVIANAWERNFQMNQFLNMEKQHAEAVRVMEETSRLASIGVITGGITHEINQPLNAIKITTDTALRKMKHDESELAQYIIRKLDVISKGTDRIDEIVRNMRNYWATPVPNTDDIQDVNLNQLVDEALSLLKRQIRNQGIKLQVNLALGDLLLKGNRIQLEQVIINLVANAINALNEVERDEKQITVRTVKKEKSIELIVEDNGKGIDQSVGEQLFDPFFSTRKGKGGSGLGLAIVRTFVSKMNGEIHFENRESGGVRFTIIFKNRASNENIGG